MKVYFIYNFSMEKEARAKVAELRGSNLEVFMFEPNDYNKKWKKIARKKIKESNYVCWLFDGNAYLNHSQNTMWEYRLAQKFHKRVIFINPEKSAKIEELINEENRSFFKKLFNEEYDMTKLNVNINSFADAKKNLESIKGWDASEVVFEHNQSIPEQTENFSKILMEQYKVMVNTTETLMNRRQTASNVFVGILSALISLVGSSFALANKVTTGIIFFAVGIITIILSMNWRKMLLDYNKNNEGKFAVINAIEKRLPANMFDSEYNYNKLKNISSYATKETVLCKIFTLIGSVVCVGGIVIIVLAALHVL